MLNKCEFIGRVGKTPETRHTQAGTKVVSFSLAATESWKNQQGEKQERTEWVNCTCFGNSRGDGLAGVVEKYVGKGDLIYICGKMQTDKYQKDGRDVYTTKIVVDDMKMLGGKGDGGQSSQGGNTGGGEPDLSDEIPW